MKYLNNPIEETNQIVLDTNILRNYVQDGDEKRREMESDLNYLRDKGYIFSITEGNAIEMSLALAESKIPWSDWLKQRGYMANLLNESAPILPESQDLLEHWGYLKNPKIDRVGSQNQLRVIWELLTESKNLSDLREGKGFLDGADNPMKIELRTLSHMQTGMRKTWDAWKKPFENVSAKDKKSVRNQSQEFIIQTMRNIAKIRYGIRDNQLFRLEGFIHYLGGTHYQNMHLPKGIKPRGSGYVDAGLAMILGWPALVCTEDGGLISVMAQSGYDFAHCIGRLKDIVEMVRKA